MFPSSTMWIPQSSGGTQGGGVMAAFTVGVGGRAVGLGGTVGGGTWVGTPGASCATSRTVGLAVCASTRSDAGQSHISAAMAATAAARRIAERIRTWVRRSMRGLPRAAAFDLGVICERFIVSPRPGQVSMRRDYIIGGGPAQSGDTAARRLPPAPGAPDRLDPLPLVLPGRADRAGGPT